MFTQTPFSLRYHMPAEFEPHSAIWLAWPHNVNHWIYWLVNEQKGDMWKYEKVLDAFCETMNVMQDSEAVNLMVNDQEMENTVRLRMDKLKFQTSNLHFFHIRTNVPWARDFGPTFVVTKNKSLFKKTQMQGNQKIPTAVYSKVNEDRNFLINAANESFSTSLGVIDWTFNAWGDKYHEGNDDDIAPTKIANLLNIPVFNPNIVTEGGSLEVNGQGTLLTTYQCMIDENRNPGLTKQDFEKIFHDYLGITNTLWLGENFMRAHSESVSRSKLINETKALNDDTDGHIDNLARFVNPTTVLCVLENNPKRANYKFQQYNFEQMQSMKNQNGKALNIIPLPTPDPVIYLDAELPASYANFYIGNKIILLPTFRQKKDDEAKEIIQHYFPNRKVIGVDSYDVIWGQGSWHCLSQQQPI